MTEALALIQALNAAMTIGINVRDTLAKVEALRAESGGSLNPEQVQKLAQEARESVTRM